MNVSIEIISLMAKRKLDNRQIRRVSKMRVASAEQSLNTEQQPGLVITNYGKKVLVKANDNQLYRCSIRQHLGKLTAGDRVVWQADVAIGTGVISQRLERSSQLTRPGFRGQTRMVAANVSLIGIVTPLLPGIHPDMIDRYLIAAEQINVPVFIILNKIDLVEDEQDWQIIEEILQPYRDLNITIIKASSKTKDGLVAINQHLNQQTSVLVGSSGAGKSSLINALIPDLEIRIGALSEATGLGQHTTTNSILYNLPTGGNLIDSPGVRSFSPQPCELHELETYYKDFSGFLGQCKFNNCTHYHEPGCAILNAVETGKISDLRWKSFRRLLEEFS